VSFVGAFQLAMEVVEWSLFGAITSLKEMLVSLLIVARPYVLSSVA
jgi:hypothetical protein